MVFMPHGEELLRDVPPPAQTMPRRTVLVFGGIALFAGVLALSAIFSNELSTRAYLRPFRVTVSPTEIVEGESLLVIWAGSKESKSQYPAERILACESSGTCQVLVAVTPNDGRERVHPLSLAPGRYSIEVRALDTTQEEAPTMRARSDEFVIHPRTE